MCSLNLTLSFNPTADMNTTDFKKMEKDYLFQESEKVLTMDGRYSPFIFNNDYRKSDNYLQNVSNCIVLDFDDGFTREEFKSMMDGFMFSIGTTKSHMKDKNGLVCERFRVIIPTETAINLNSEEYSNMMREIFEVFTQADTACKDTARAYSGFGGAEVEIYQGELFDWIPYHEKALKRKELRKWQIQQREKPQVENNGTKADWYRENWLSDVMRAALGVDEKFVSGNRNNAIYSIARYLKEIELTDNEICNAIDWVNNGELGDFEIKQVLRGLRVAT